MRRGRPTEDFATVDSFAMVDIILVGILTILVLKKLLRGNTPINRILPASGEFLLMMYLLGILTFFWSPMPNYSGYRAYEVFINIFAVYISLSYFSLENLEKAALTLAVGALFIFYGGRWLEMGVSSIAALHVDAATAAMIFAYCFGELISAPDEKRKKILRRLAVISLGILVISTSSSSNIAAAFGMLTAIFSKRNRFLAFSLLLILVLVSFMMVSGADDLQSALFLILFPGKNYETVMSGTGRVQVLEYYWPLVYDHPWFGHGFAIATRTLGFYANTAHNIFLDICLAIGFVGFSLFFLFFLNFINENVKATKIRMKSALGCRAMFAAGLVNCLGSPFIGNYWSVPIIVFSSFLALQHFSYYLRTNRNV